MIANTLTRTTFRPTAALSQLADENPAPVVVLVDGRMAYANRAAGEALGVQRTEDLIGRRFLDFAPGRRLNAWERLLCDGMTAEEEPLMMALPLLRADGSEIHYAASAAGTRLGARRAVQVIMRKLADQPRQDPDYDPA